MPGHQQTFPFSGAPVFASSARREHRAEPGVRQFYYLARARAAAAASFLRSLSMRSTRRTRSSCNGRYSGQRSARRSATCAAVRSADFGLLKLPRTPVRLGDLNPGLAQAGAVDGFVRILAYQALGRPQAALDDTQCLVGDSGLSHPRGEVGSHSDRHREGSRIGRLRFTKSLEAICRLPGRMPRGRRLAAPDFAAASPAWPRNACSRAAASSGCRSARSASTVAARRAACSARACWPAWI